MPGMSVHSLPTHTLSKWGAAQKKCDSGSLEWSFSPSGMSGKYVLPEEPDELREKSIFCPSQALDSGEWAFLLA